MSKDLLLEIGTEEVPAHAMPGILAELKENAAKALADLRLAYGDIRTIGTPRRMALLVTDLAERQPDVTEERRGPSAAVAFDAEGNLTKAGLGFARGAKVEPQDLVTKDGYVYAAIHEAGEETSRLLSALLPDLIAHLSFPNSMRWGDLDFRFIRPLRWLVALYGSEVIPFTLAGIRAGRTSRGHRFLGRTAFDIAAAADYERACEKEYVIVDPARRREMIRRQIEAVAAENGGTAEISEELLEEVVYLVEYPTALAGRFEEKYLALPPEAVVTPMRDHQRYFPVKDAAGRLLPLFITVRNGGTDYLDTVRHGNERVLRARLADAQFFFDEDRKKSLMAHREKLKTVVFQEGLGTVYEKTERLARLAETIGEKLGATAEETAQARRAALLSKADLVTGMVTEFTELQGVMGRAYALLDGEEKAVAVAIDEHYRPRFAGDAEPETVPGRILSLADKMDNIVATFSRGLIPTGSQDPFALRRQALGLANMLIRAKYSLSILAIADQAMDLLHITEQAARKNLRQEIAAFLRLRLKNIFDEEGVRYDVAEAVLSDVDDIYACYGRGQAVAEALLAKDMTAVIQAFVRAGNIAAKGAGGEIDPALFAVPEEKNLYQAFTSAKSAVDSLLEGQDYAGAIDALRDLAAPIDALFDAVMVMDKEAKIRQNRLALLFAVDRLIRRVADFDKIVL